MARDPVSRWLGKRKAQKLDGLAQRGRSAEDIDAERELIEKTKKVDPIKADSAPGRNDPCPCGSGRKYKKCCGRKV